MLTSLADAREDDPVGQRLVVAAVGDDAAVVDAGEILEDTQIETFVHIGVGAAPVDIRVRAEPAGAVAIREDLDLHLSVRILEQAPSFVRRERAGEMLGADDQRHSPDVRHCPRGDKGKKEAAVAGRLSSVKVAA